MKRKERKRELEVATKDEKGYLEILLGEVRIDNGANDSNVVDVGNEDHDDKCLGSGRKGRLFNYTANPSTYIKTSFLVILFLFDLCIFRLSVDQTQGR